MSLTDTLKGSFIAGLVLVAPLVVTVLVLRVLVGWATGVLDPVVASTRLAQYTANVQLAAQVLAAVLIVVLLTALGYFARRRSGQRLFGAVGRAVHFVPLVRTIYGSTRQVANALVDRGSRYESAVLVEYPRPGVYAIGFVTGESPDAAVEVAGETVYNVFLPNSPNPTGGNLSLVPESRVHETDMGVRQSIRLLVTTGISETPEELKDWEEAGEREDGGSEEGAGSAVS